jgi:hypothetical protein
MKLNLRTIDPVYVGDLCGQRADSVAWLRGQIRSHETTDIYGADEILQEVERVLRSIANAYDAQDRAAHGAANDGRGGR